MFGQDWFISLFEDKIQPDVDQFFFSLIRTQLESACRSIENGNLSGKVAVSVSTIGNYHHNAKKTLTISFT